MKYYPVSIPALDSAASPADQLQSLRIGLRLDLGSAAEVYCIDVSVGLLDVIGAGVVRPFRD